MMHVERRLVQRWFGGGNRWVVIIALFISASVFAAPAPSERSGFEIGNGSVLDSNLDWLSIEDIGELEPDYNGKIAEIFAPRSDGGYPRTRLRLDVYWIGTSAEEALNAFAAASKGWVEFAIGKIVGVHKEIPVGKEWNRFEMQLFSKDQRYLIRLEGNKKTSKAYSRVATSLISEAKTDKR